MSLLLSALKFNHDPSTVANNALTIRRNASQAVVVPEWRLGASVYPWDSVAAYAVDALRGQTVTIQASFLRTDARLRRAEVRAWELALPGAQVLGPVQARNIEFPGQGDPGFLSFQLPQHRLDSRGVGVSDLGWRWQSRRSPLEAWTDFALTFHRIYTVLKAPTSPWQPGPATPWNTDLPWTEVLDYACRWAHGAHDVDEAATRITRAVHALGVPGGLLSYDCYAADFGIGMPHYSMGLPEFGQSWFACSKFLERLRGGLGQGAHVNCSDCATIVSTFANALGCDLSQSTMVSKVGSAFPLNPTRAIGAREWLSACGVGAFSMHEVAWTGAAGEEDAVFDACLELDADADPLRLPHIPLLPTNLRFGKPGDGSYLDRLVAPQGRANCRPSESPQRRRVL